MDGRVKVLTNSGGLNPVSASLTLMARARALGQHIRVACVTGDDTPLLPSLIDEEPPDVRFANVYLGARPLVDALEQGAEVVVAGVKPTRRSPWPRWSTSSGGRGTIGTGWQRERWSGTSSSAPAKPQGQPLVVLV
jgi:hypothetical protein